MLCGVYKVQNPQAKTNGENAHAEEREYTQQKEIDSEDVCSICQEVFLEKKLPVTFCR